MSLDLSLHEDLIYSLIHKSTVFEHLKEDVYQDFCVYFYSYNTYDATRGKPSTFITHVFKNFMIRFLQNSKRHRPLDTSIRIEARDVDYVERELGFYDESVEDAIFINKMMENATDDTLDLLIGPSTVRDLANRDGVSRQAIEGKYHRELKKLRGEEK